ncbi:unnamed protein product, partial [Rotaria socialis]
MSLSKTRVIGISLGICYVVGSE